MARLGEAAHEQSPRQVLLLSHVQASPKAWRNTKGIRVQLSAAFRVCHCPGEQPCEPAFPGMVNRASCTRGLWRQVKMAAFCSVRWELTGNPLGKTAPLAPGAASTFFSRYLHFLMLISGAYSHDWERWLRKDKVFAYILQNHSLFLNAVRRQPPLLHNLVFA